MSDVIQTTEEVTEQAAPAITEPEETEQTPAAEPEQPAEVATPEPEPAPEQPDYQEKFRNSASEALILHAQVKQKDDLLNKLTSQDAPSESEILAEYPDYQGFDETSKKFVIDVLTTKKRQARIDRHFAEQEAERSWQQELKSVTSKPGYNSLASDPEFEKFVFQPKHKGLDVQVLADAYLMRTGKVAPQPTRQVQKQPAMPTATVRQTPKSNKISLEEASKIRQTNHKEYLRLVKAGMIDDEL